MTKMRWFSIALFASGAIAYSELPADACEIRREYIGGARYWHCRNIRERVYTSVTGCPSNEPFKQCHEQQWDEAKENWNRLVDRKKFAAGGGGSSRFQGRTKRSLMREFNTAGLRRAEPLPRYRPRMRRIRANYRRVYY